MDIDHCRETALSQGVSAVPTFIFFRSKAKLATLRGADPASLEAKIQELLGSEPSEGTSSETVQGHVSKLMGIQTRAATTRCADSRLSVFRLLPP